MTSSPYKQSHLDRIEERKTKPKKKCSANPKKAKKAKVASMSTITSGTGSKDNVQCVTDFGLNHCQEEWGQCSICEN